MINYSTINDTLTLKLRRSAQSIGEFPRGMTTGGCQGSNMLHGRAVLRRNVLKDHGDKALSKKPDVSSTG